MGKPFFKRIFSRKPKKAQAPVLENNQQKNPEYLRFIIKQLAFQSAYFHELTGIHNRMIKKIEFYRKSTPRITGVQKHDIALTRNMRRMRRLEEKINLLRRRVRKLSSLKQAKNVADEARKLESEFNDLKEANFLLFQKHFGPAKNNNGSGKKNGRQ